jgi:hypothetical protein
MESTLYWTAVVIGIFVIFLTYKWNKTYMETFQSAQTTEGAGSSSTTTATTTTTNTIPSDYNEVTNTTNDFRTRFPYFAAGKVFAYVSALSRTTMRGSDPNAVVFSKDRMKWLDMIGRNDFNIQTNISLPATLILDNNVIGLPLKNVKLESTSESDNFGTNPASQDFTLSTFSASFFMKWNSLPDNDETVLTLFELFAETPNHVSWRLKNASGSSVVMEVVLGDADTSYVWTIPKSTFISNGNHTLYTMAYNRDTKSISVFIGMNEYKKSIDTIPSIILSNSHAVINSERNIDANLLAFVFHKDVALTMSDIVILSDYFIRESGGNSAILGDTLQRMRTTEDELARLRAALEAARNTCPSNSSTNTTEQKGFTPVGRYNKWAINTDFKADHISTEDLKKCSPLNIKDFGDAVEDSPLERQLPPDLASQRTARKPFGDFDIINPARTSSSTTETSSSTTPPSTSTTTATPPATTNTATSSNTTPPSTSTATTTPPATTNTATSSNATTPPPPATTESTQSGAEDYLSALLNQLVTQRTTTDQTERSATSSTPVNDRRDPGVSQVGFFDFISKYMF